MKKINLRNLSMDEVLSKDELKKIVGGGNGSTAAQNYHCYCNQFPLDLIVFPDIESSNDYDDMVNYMSGLCLDESFECYITGT